MNTAAKAIANGSVYYGPWAPFAWLKHHWMVGILCLSVLLSAVGVIYVKNVNRKNFSELQSLQIARDNLHVRWGQLLLEENTWAAQARVENIARKQLHMAPPPAKDVVIIRQ